jgi:hypothetical protein
MQKQEQLNWCWAAVCASVATFHHDQRWRQCTIVNAVLSAILGGADCCTSGASDTCNMPWDLRAALLRTGHLAAPVSGPLPFATVQTHIANQRPVACRISSPGPTAHFIAIIGCAQTAMGQQWLTVVDPSPSAPETSTLLYNDLMTNYFPNSRWDQTFQPTWRQASNIRRRCFWLM